MEPYDIDFTIATSEQIIAALCERLEKIRLSRNLTQAQLASRAGVTKQTISNMENARGGLSMDTFVRVLTALNLQGNLKALLPDPSIRPVERVNLGRERKRARVPRKTPASKPWAWKDDQVNPNE
jgi:putative transcriptional regulator